MTLNDLQIGDIFWVSLDEDDEFVPDEPNPYRTIYQALVEDITPGIDGAPTTITVWAYDQIRQMASYPWINEPVTTVTIKENA